MWGAKKVEGFVFGNEAGVAPAWTSDRRVDRDWHDFFVTRLLDHQISSGRWQINRTQNRNNLYFLDIVHIIIVFMFFKIFVFLKYEKTYCLAHFVHGLMDMRVVDFLAKN